MLFEGACGLNTLTSKNVLCEEHPQNPSAAMSRRAPSSVLAEDRCIVSVVIG